MVQVLLKNLRRWGKIICFGGFQEGSRICVTVFLVVLTSTTKHTRAQCQHVLPLANCFAKCHCNIQGRHFLHAKNSCRWVGLQSPHSRRHETLAFPIKLGPGWGVDDVSFGLPDCALHTVISTCTTGLHDISYQILFSVILAPDEKTMAAIAGHAKFCF